MSVNVKLSKQFYAESSNKSEVVADRMRNAVLSMAGEAAKMGVGLNWGSLEIQSEVLEISRSYVSEDKAMTSLIMLEVTGERE